jgi:hypothetical protein
MATMKKAQAGIELTAIMGIFLIIILFYSVWASGILSHFGIQRNYDDAYRAVQDLSIAADSVYLQGEGAAKSVQVVLPENSQLHPSKSYIGRSPLAPSSQPNTINLNLGGTDIYVATRSPLSGTFPNKSGEYVFQVVSHGSYVSINSNLVDAEPGSILVRMQKNSSQQAVLVARSHSGGITGVNLTSSWNHSHVSLSVHPQFFEFSGEAAMPVVLNFTADGQAGGLYYSQLHLIAYGDGGSQSQESISIPMMIDVYGG